MLLLSNVECIPICYDYNLLSYMLDIIGDFDARIGKDDGIFTYHQHTNRNGSSMLYIIKEKQLVVINTSFQNKMNKMWTYMDLSGRKYQLDYILIRKKWRNSNTNVEAYSSFSSTGPDHRIVFSNIRLSLRSNRNTLPRKIPYNWPLFKSDKSLQDKYTVEINNRFHFLDGEDISEVYERFIKVNSEVASEIVPIKPKKVNICPSTDETVNKAREDTHKACKTYEDKVNDTNQNKNTESRKKLYTAYKNIAISTLEEKVEQIENADINRRYLLSWELINEITGRKCTQKDMIKGRNQKERLKIWYNHFQGLLERPTKIEEDEPIIQVLPPLEIKRGTFDINEYKRAKDTIKEGKSCGMDEICPEVLKRCDLDAIVLQLCNRAHDDKAKPRE